MDDELVAKRYPYFKFYPSDWRGDPALRLCSLEERGLWIEMIAIMHEADPYGHLIVKGTPIDAQQLAALVGITQNLAKKLLKNLENFGVFSRTSEGIIFSRKMVRDFESRAKSKDFGSLGGNPSLKGVNPPLNPRLKPQSPESIVQNNFKDTNVSLKKGGRSKKIDEIAANEILGELAKAIPIDLAQSFVSHREVLKSPLTLKGAQIITKKLLVASDAVEAVENSISNGWRGVFPPKARAGPTIKNGSDLCLAALERMKDEDEQHNAKYQQELTID